MNRRHFLRSSGITVALPLLESLMPRALAATTATSAAGSPKRMVLINASMGLLPKDFFPKGAGRDYEMSSYLSEFSPLRDKFSVFSGLSHPEVDGGHHADFCYLTGAGHPGGSGFKNTISVDQFAAERVGIRTRVPSLVLHAGAEAHKSGLSWTASGVPLPAEDSPSRVYRRLFLKGTRQETQARLEDLRSGRSVLDAVSDRAKSMARDATAADRDKLDEYFTSVRELEGRLVTVGEWEKKDRPEVDRPIPVDIADSADVVGRTRLMYDMIKLALQTDSTRIVSLKVHSYNRVLIPGVNDSHHALTHHGGREDAIRQLRLIELARLRELRDFLTHLHATPETDGSLLDNTMVMYGSHMGDANRHTNINLPVMLAGGGFRHGAHHVFDQDGNAPLANLFVSMLQRMGLETDTFASATGTLGGLEI